MQTSFDAVVIGAGPAGSSAATLLAQAGWSVAVVERQSFPRRKVCGECIAASNLPLLDALGLGQAFTAAAGPELRRVALMHGARSISAELPAAAAVHPWGRALGRETLDVLLLERARAAGAVVLQPWSVCAVAGQPGAHRIGLRSLAHGAPATEATLQARVLIDAHGSWQALAADRGAVRSKPRRAADLLAFKANFDGAALPDGLLTVLAFRGGYGGIVVADAGIATLACCIRRDRFEAARRAAPGHRSGDVVEALLRRECDGVDVALAPAQRSGAWLAAGPLAPGIRIAARDTCFRVGNAAGEAHPIIGEGISMALQSAWLLCGRLVACGEPPDAARQRAILAAYARQWRREFAPRLRLAAACAQLAMRPAASPLLAIIGHWPHLLALGARWGGKVRCAADTATMARLAANPSSR